MNRALVGRSRGHQRSSLLLHGFVRPDSVYSGRESPEGQSECSQPANSQDSKPHGELGRGYARLKLNLVLGHRSILLRGSVEDRAPGAGSGCEIAS